MGEIADAFVNHWISGEWSPFTGKKQKRRDRKRHRVIECRHCGAKHLRIVEFHKDEWHLGEFDENNVMTRHVCKMKKRLRNV